MVGKWHLCPTVEMNLASTRRNWPTGRGFERWYGFLGAETSQWYPELTYDNHPVDQPRIARGGLPLRRGHHRQGDRVHHGRQGGRAGQAVLPLLRARRRATRRTTPPRSGSRSTPGRFDEGYEAMREATLARQIEMGIVPPNTELPPMNPIGTPGDPHRPRRPALLRRGHHPALGLAVRARSSGSSPGWPRCTPGSCPTPTPRSGGCSTTSRRPASGRTPWSSSSRTTGPAVRAARTGRSTRCCS